GARLLPGASVGTLTLGGLTAGDNSIFDYEFSGASTYDRTIISNTLTLDGASNAAFNLFLAGSITPWTSTGTYKLIQFASIAGTPLDASWTTDSASNPHVLNRVAGTSYRFSTTTDPGFLDLIVLGPATWNVNSGGNWETAANWNPTIVPGGIGTQA